MKAMQTSQGQGLSDSLINASSLDDKYKLIKSESEFKLDRALSAIKISRGKTLKDRIQNRLSHF